jgi:hypothetical protein
MSEQKKVKEEDKIVTVRIEEPDIRDEEGFMKN